MKKFKLFIWLFLIFILVSCDNSSNDPFNSESIYSDTTLSSSELESFLSELDSEESLESSSEIIENITYQKDEEGFYR